MEDVEEKLVIGIIMGMLVIMTALLIYCYKKSKNKPSCKEDEVNACTEPPYTLKKRPSDKFTIPLISMDEHIPFTILEESVTEEAISPIQKEHYPPASKMILSYDQDGQKKVKRSISCPIRYQESELDDNIFSECYQPPIYGSSEGSSETKRRTKSMGRKLETKSTRGQLELPPPIEGRKISVYEDTIMDVSQTTLARRRGSLLTQTESYKKAGMIHFSTEYLEHDKTFQISIHRVTDLTRRNATSQINPFARLYLSPGKKCKQDTKVIQDTNHPNFNEVLEFQNITKEDLTEQKLKIKLYSQDRIRRKELLGQVDILMSSLTLVGKETFDIHLFKQRSTVSMTSVSITLCHQATFSRLEVFIDKLKKVPKGSVSSSIYGALTLYRGDMSISRNTTIKYHSKDPIFQEMITFQDLLTNSSTPLSSFSLVFSLVERSIIGQDQILGHVIFNMSSPQFSALKQWQAVDNKPHTNHSSWHYLVDPDELK